MRLGRGRRGGGNETMIVNRNIQAPTTKPLRTRRSLSAGLVGRGIQASRSPRMHEAEGARLGLDYTYRLFDFDQLGLDDSNLPALIGRLRDEGHSGLNVTHPFKERVIAGLDGLSGDAAAIGAVNTIVFRHGTAVGHNTDCWGFGESFSQSLTEPRLGSVVLIGAGGAGMAVARSLLKLGAGRLTIFDIDRAKAVRLAEALRVDFGGARLAETSDLEAPVSAADGLVNATPIGMAKYPGMPLDKRWLRPDMWIADIVYFPAETELLSVARAIGCQTLPGSGMAIFQAVKAFELITGVAPDAAKMALHFGDR